METVEPKLSYYQRNRDKILEKRRLKRLENTKQGRPFPPESDEETEITPEPVLMQVVEPEPLEIPVKKSKKTKKGN